MSDTTKRKGGRPQTSARKYFSQVDETDDSKCQITMANGKMCGEIVKGGHRYGGNLKQHLTDSKDANHKEIRKSVDDEDSQIKSKSQKSRPDSLGDSQQSKMTDHLKPKPFSKTSIDYARITDAMALFFAGTNCPKSIVKHPLFKNRVFL